MVNLSFLKRKRSPKTLREYMKKNHIKTQADLAEKLNVSEAYISRYFSKDRSFGAKTALRISEITGIPVENLIQ